MGFVVLTSAFAIYTIHGTYQGIVKFMISMEIDPNNTWKCNYCK